MGNDHIRSSSSSQDRREQAQTQGKYADARRYRCDKSESWHIGDFDRWSDELKEIIAIITGGFQIGKAWEEKRNETQ